MRKTIILILMFVVLSSFVSAPVNDDLEVVLNLDESAGEAEDKSGNKYNFTVNGATQNQPAKNSSFGTAYYFTTNDYLNKSHEDVFDFGGANYYDFSICFFKNSTSWTGGGEQTILSTNDGSNKGIQIGRFQDDSIYFFTADGGGISQSNHNFSGGNPDNKWIHICIIVNNSGTTHTIVEDNFADQSTALATARDVTGSNLEIGRRAGAGDRYYTGFLDEMVIWNRSIGPEEIDYHYNNQYPEVVTDTCSCPGSGDWVIDCSDDCSIDTNCDIAGNDIIINGATGSFSILANITADSFAYEVGCEVNNIPNDNKELRIAS